MRLAICTLSLMATVYLSGCSSFCGPPPNNIFDEMLQQSVSRFANTAKADYASYDYSLDGWFALSEEEDGFIVEHRYRLELDEDSQPYKLQFTEIVYLPIHDDDVLVILSQDIYSNKTDRLRAEKISYSVTNPVNLNDLGNPTTSDSDRIPSEEAEALLDEAGLAEKLEGISRSPAEYFVELYLSCMDSSFSAENWGEFNDTRQQDALSREQ